ncbi:MAG: GNAT family N-acetyltransferase [Anaerolineae bacterium]|nr:GNAT family N-acetyltransferase [Anaerolineae bacterium]
MPFNERTALLSKLEFEPVTPERWADLEQLFGPRGATGGCWCMLWRLKRSDYDRQKGDGNKQAMKSIVEHGPPPGILAYLEGEPVGWGAIQPREVYPALGRSRILKPVDEQPVWSITCFFVRKDLRGQGLSVRLIRAAVTYAASQGATIIEAYPVEPKSDNMPAVFAWVGFAASFRQAGFKEVLRRSETRPIMRLELSKPA